MDEQRLLYFADNQKSISKLLAEVIEMQKDMRKKVKQLNEVVLSDDVFSQSPYPIKSGFWLPSAYLAAVSWYTIVISDSLSLKFNVVLTPKGWYLHFFDRKLKRTSKQVEDWVNERKIKFKLNSEKNRLIYIGENDSLPYSASLEDSGKWALDMLKRLTATLD